MLSESVSPGDLVVIDPRMVHAARSGRFLMIRESRRPDTGEEIAVLIEPSMTALRHWPRIKKPTLAIFLEYVHLSERIRTKTRKARIVSKKYSKILLDGAIVWVHPAVAKYVHVEQEPDNENTGEG